MKREVTMRVSDDDAFLFIGNDADFNYVLDYNLNVIDKCSRAIFVHEDYHKHTVVCETTPFDPGFVPAAHYGKINMDNNNVYGITPWNLVIPPDVYNSAMSAFTERDNYRYFQVCCDDGFGKTIITNYTIKQPICDTALYKAMPSAIRCALYMAVQLDILSDIKYYIAAMLLRVLREDTSWYTIVC